MKKKVTKSKKKIYCDGSAMCGGVVSQSEFDSDPWAYMMCYVMPDNRFEKYKKIKDPEAKKMYFDLYARSVI